MSQGRGVSVVACMCVCVGVCVYVCDGCVYMISVLASVSSIGSLYWQRPSLVPHLKVTWATSAWSLFHKSVRHNFDAFSRRLGSRHPCTVALNWIGTGDA